MKNIILSAGLFLAFISCSENENEQNLATADLMQNDVEEITSNEFPSGTKYSLSEVAIQGAYNQFKQTLNKNEAIGIIAEVDHARNAKSIEEDLNYTRVIFFGNPNLGTPLMQRNQLAGLDLSQKVLFYKDENKNDVILYNSVEYLRSRHDLDGVETLPKISVALENLVSGVSKNEILAADQQTVGYKEGIETKLSELSFEESYAALKNALESNPNISIMAELDHQANAARVGLELNPTRIIIFGNPNLGTPLMKEEQSIGLDLPQKMLVWENSEGEVYVSYNDAYFIAGRHSVESNEEILNTINNALDNLSNVATGN
ncbi:MAG TPA: DUF302 domain-containing protein [Christiangramia sp.]|nr:DUF302 domain-containing protein [Christiangramia sp.]